MVCPKFSHYQYRWAKKGAQHLHTFVLGELTKFHLFGVLMMGQSKCLIAATKKKKNLGGTPNLINRRNNISSLVP
jgi:hypothetical protein